MANISKLNVNGTAYNLRDAAAMHYLGHTTTDIVPGTTGASITIGGTSVTAVANDYVTSGTSNLNYIWNGTAWELLSEAAAEIPVQDVTVAGTSVLDTSDHTAKIVVATASDAATPKFGVVQTGANITNTNGVISVEDADASTKGVVQLSTAIPSDPATAVDTKAATEKAVADAIDAIPVKDVTVNGTSVVDSADQTAKVVINAATVAIDSTTDSNNVLPDGVKATTQQTSDDSTLLATTEFVHDLFDDIANPMIFKGDATLTADSTDPTTAAITVSGSVKKGYTYKITSIAASPAYTGNLKVGDTIIADKDNPKVTADWVAGTDWTVVPSGDENDGTVMSVEASAAQNSNLVVTVEDTTTHSTSAITEAGSITVGIATGYQLLSDADKAKVDTIGTSAPVFNSVTTGSSASGDNSAAPAHVGDTSQGEDADTLYIDFLNFGTADVIGEEP